MSAKKFACALFAMLIIGFGLTACDSTEPENTVQPTARPAEAQSEAPKPPPPPPVTEEEKARANLLLGFYNRAVHGLDSGYLGVPAKISRNLEYYRTNWALPDKIEVPPKDLSVMTPPKGIFSEAEEKVMAAAANDMEKAVKAMLDFYRKLELYVDNPAIQDDGKQGQELLGQLDGQNIKYMAARKTWLDTVETRTAAAEEALLQDHPLARQISASRNILQTIEVLANLLKANSLHRQDLGMLIQTLEVNIENGAKPPFQAPPGLERLYREFLRSVQDCVNILKRCEAEGIFSYQRRELGRALNSCQTAYNAFAAALNGSSI